jgi:dephospho-CoA kinase
MLVGKESMKMIGLTGGMGSGKTIVAELLRIQGVPVYDSDTRSKELCQTDKTLIKGLIDLFGEDVYQPDGRLNKTFMAQAIFNDRNLLQASNDFIHPAVGRDFLDWASRQDAPIVVQETAILFEAGQDDRFDLIVCVTAPEELRVKRSCARSGLSVDAVRARMQNQLSEEERILRSDFIIVNDEHTALIPQVEALLKLLA